MCSWVPATARIPPCPAGRIASNWATPNIPMLEIVNVPELYSSGDNVPDLAFPTSS